MKKLVIFILGILSLSYASASTCVDLKSIVARGHESSNVRSLQNFLYEIGYLKAKPNGYFGAGTLAAVKAYQKSIGLSPVGSVGPGTRAAIKKESCGESSSSQSTQTGVNTGDVVTTRVEPVIKPAVPVINTPSGLRNTQRRADLEKLLKNMYARFADSRGVHPVAITDTPIELCVVPPYIVPTATATEVAVLVTPDSPCKDLVDITYLAPTYMMWIPRDPSIATTSALTGYTITRSDTNQITLAAKAPEDGAIVKVTCNFNGYCKDFRHISTVLYGIPVYASSSRSIIIRDTVTKDPLMLYGKNFTATNTVELLSNYTGRKYVLGTFASTDNGTTLPLSSSSTNQTFPCGNGCQDKIPLGDYSFTISSESGTSNPGYFSFKGVTTSSISTHSDSTVTPNTKNVKLGSIAISAGTPIKLKSLTITGKAATSSSVLASKIGPFVLKDSMDGTSYGGPTFSLGTQTLYENQSKVFDLYADIAEVETYQSGFITYSGTFTITDALTGTDMDLPMKDISFTVSY